MPDQTHPQYILPSSPYGITSTRYVDVENPLLPLPQRNVMLAANRLNDYRYSKLTDRQRIFIDIYLSSGFNAAEAAQRAGFCTNVPKDENYQKTCGSIGRRLLKSKFIAIGVQLAMDYHAERSKIVVDDLIMELRHVAFSNMGDYFVNDGNGDPHLQMPEDHDRAKLAAVSEITLESYDEGRGDNRREVKKIKFKLHNKLEAIDKLLKIAVAKGDPAVAGLDKAGNAVGTSVVNVFNFMPVPSGEYLPPPQPPTLASVPQIAPQQQLAPQLQPPQQLTHSLPLHDITPRAPAPPPDWAQPETPQKRPLTIDHE